MKKVIFLLLAAAIISFTSVQRLKSTSPIIDSSYTGQLDIYLSLQASDFVGNDYTSVTDCAVARAFKRQLHVSYCLVGPYDIIRINNQYNSKVYSIDANGFHYSDFEWNRFVCKFFPRHVKVIHLKRI